MEMVIFDAPWPAFPVYVGVQAREITKLNSNRLFVIIDK